MPTREQEGLEKVKTPDGLLPVCAWCKRVRDDQGVWIEVDVRLRSEAEFTHGICPECLEKHLSSRINDARDFADKRQTECNGVN